MMSVCLLRVLDGHIENITAAASTHISHIGNKWRVLRIHVDLVAVHVLDFNFAANGGAHRAMGTTDGVMEAGVEATLDFETLVDARPSQAWASMGQASVMTRFASTGSSPGEMKASKSLPERCWESQGSLATL